MPIKRKTVTYLNQLTDDVDETQQALGLASEYLESATFELCTLDVDEIRTNTDHVGGLYEACLVAQHEFNHAMVAFKNACDKYKEFF